MWQEGLAKAAASEEENPACEALQAPDGGTLVPDPAQRAITVPMLRKVMQYVKDHFASGGVWKVTRYVDGQKKEVEIDDYKQVNLYDVNTHVILAATKERQCSLAELMCAEARPCPPDYFVSHWWGEPVHEFLMCLERHAGDRHADGQIDGRPVAYWVCAYCNNQHNLDAEINTPLRETSFHRAMTSPSCAGTVVVVDSGATVFSRIWCVYEFYLSTNGIHEGHTFDLVTSSNGKEAVCLMDGACHADEKITWKPVAQSKAEREAGFPIALIDKGIRFKCEEAEASYEGDKDRIIEDIRQHSNESRVNEKVRGLIAAAGSNLVDIDDSREKLEEYLRVVETGKVAKLGIGHVVKSQEVVSLFLQSASENELTELFVGTPAIASAISDGDLLSNFASLAVLK